MAREKLKKWEDDHGYKANFVAKRLGIDHSTWSNIKSGRTNPTYKLLAKFKDEFEVEDVITLFAED